MAALISTGQPAPLFQLHDLEGVSHALADSRGRIVVLNFWSAECPHAARTDRELLALLPAWGGRVQLLPVASNASEPPELLRRTAAARGLPAVLHDPGARVATLYGAVTTPHLFVIDPHGILRYQGAFDNATFRQRTPTQFYLHAAVEALLAGRPPDPPETPPHGCTIVRFDRS